MSFLWPTNLKRDPDGFVRFGRMIHWLGLLIAGALVAVGIGWTFQPGGDPIIALEFFGALGSVFYFAGRGFRYVFSGE